MFQNLFYHDCSWSWSLNNILYERNIFPLCMNYLGIVLSLNVYIDQVQIYTEQSIKSFQVIDGC